MTAGSGGRPHAENEQAADRLQSEQRQQETSGRPNFASANRRLRLRQNEHGDQIPDERLANANRRKDASAALASQTPR